jgi:hypothetical protein
VFQELVTLARRRGCIQPCPKISGSALLHSTQGVYIYIVRTGKRRIPLMSRLTLPDRHPHRRPIVRDTIQTTRPIEQHRHMFGSSVVAGSTLNQEKGRKRSCLFPFQFLSWSFREFPSSLPALVRVGGEHGRPSAIGLTMSLWCIENYVWCPCAVQLVLYRTPQSNTHPASATSCYLDTTHPPSISRCAPSYVRLPCCPPPSTSRTPTPAPALALVLAAHRAKCRSR